MSVEPLSAAAYDPGYAESYRETVVGAVVPTPLVQARRISAVVVTYHTGPRLRECLYALVSDPDVSEIIIVNNGNPPDVDAFIARFERKYTGVTVINTNDNLGFGRAANIGARKAAHPLLLFINPDAVLKRGSAADMRMALADKPSPAIVGGRIFNVDGSEQRGARRGELTLWRAFGTFTGLSALPGIPDVHRNRTPLPKDPMRMEVISGALFMIDRKGFLDTLGGFDEEYFLHVEDIDLCRRAREAGGSVTYTPHGCALHYGSTSNVPRPFVEKHKAEGLARYFRKFADTQVEKTLARIASPLLVMLLVGRANLLAFRARFTPWKR